jgi:peptide/nickel transport system substrate-binding protein
MSVIETMSNEVASTSVSRRHFIQGAAAAGAAVALPVAGVVGAGAASAAQQTLRVSIGKIANPVAPFTTADAGSLQILCCVGEYLAFSDDKAELAPRVAESWKGSAGGKVWTFKIRKGITFHDGSKLTADDVVWTFKSHLTASNKSQSIGKFNGILDINGVEKVDQNTVKFTLLSAVGTFPSLLSSTSYGLLIMKNGENGGAGWQNTMNGCGPWILDTYTKGTQCTFVKNENYWDAKRQPSFNNLVTIVFESQEAAVAQLVTGKLDAVTGVTPATAAKINKSKAELVKVPSAGHISTHLRCDFGPFSTDKRIRQAAALTLDREAFIKKVLKGQALMASDSIMDAFATKDTSVPQRKKDIAKAKALMADAGSKGFNVDLSSYHRDDIDALAPFLKASMADIGINVTLVLADSYYTAPWDSRQSKKVENHYWLESNMGITDWGHRGTPVEILTRAYKSTGDWNAAHFASAKFDAAADEFITATTPAKAKAASKKIQELCLEETPYIMVYFETRTSVVKKGLKGFYTNGMGQFESAGASY